MRAARLILHHRAAGPLVALALFVVCAACAVQLRFLNDEGIFSYDFAAALPRAFFPILFFFKAKALIVLLYALPARLGVTGYLLAHAAAAAATILLTVAAARRWDLPSPNLAAWALAGSLGFLVAAGSGFANSDGAFFLALFLWLYAGERRVWAALVLGALPFVRYELAFTSAVFVGFDLWRRRDARFVLAVLGFPLLYGLGGALYHRDLLWPIHTFPNTIQPAAIRRYQMPHARDLGRFLLGSLVVNFSALGLLGLLAWNRRDRRLTPLFVAAAGTYLLLILFAAFSLWFAIDRSLRYHVAPLPLVALLAASFRARTPGGEVRTALVVMLQIMALVAMFAGSDYGREQHVRDHSLASAVRASRLWHGQPIYTDLQILRYDRCAEVDSWMLANDSIVYELEGSLDRDNGQRNEVVAALAAQRFLVERGPVRRDALYLLDASDRGRRLREYVEGGQPASVRVGRYWLYGWP